MQFVGSDNLNKRYSHTNNTSDVLKREQKKLEKMILESFKKGDTNLGKNEDVLRQSMKVDKLIVNEMRTTGMTGDDC